MKFPVTTSPGHEGKTLEIDPAREIISLQNGNGAVLGAISWGDVIERIASGDEDARFAHARAHARAPLALKFKYTTPEGKMFDSLRRDRRRRTVYRKQSTVGAWHRTRRGVRSPGSTMGKAQSQGESGLDTQ